MQLSTPGSIKQLLFSKMDTLLQRRDEFLVNSDKNFTRVKKISFEQTLLFPMVAGSDNIDEELMDLFPESVLPSPSAMIQRRNQVKPSAYLELFSQFKDALSVSKKYRGYNLAAFDGSRLNLPYNPSDKETYIQCIPGRKGINQYHLNALYDPLNHLFLDVELQPVTSMNEKGAFCSVLDRNRDSLQKTIFIADRGFASYNIFAHAINNRQLFLIRVPESFALTICTNKNRWLESEKSDEEISIHVGRTRKKTAVSLENYHYISKNGHYDFISSDSDKIDAFQVRVLKFPISESSYEYLVTNLPRYAFSIQSIKELYHIRWGVETAFRHLKYAANMVHIHSLKKNLILQEIYAKLTLYNFSSAVAACADICHSKTTKKHKYVINRTKMMKTCIRFLQGRISEIVETVVKNLVPVRPGRSFQRNLRRQSAGTIHYR